MPALKLRQDNLRTIPYQGHGGNAIAFDSTTGRASLGNFRPLRHRKRVTRSVPPGT